jgi:hypothetical protein
MAEAGREKEYLEAFVAPGRSQADLAREAAAAVA